MQINTQTTIDLRMFRSVRNTYFTMLYLKLRFICSFAFFSLFSYWIFLVAILCLKLFSFGTKNKFKLLHFIECNKIILFLHMQVICWIWICGIRLSLFIIASKFVLFFVQKYFDFKMHCYLCVTALNRISIFRCCCSLFTFAYIQENRETCLGISLYDSSWESRWESIRQQ